MGRPKRPQSLRNKFAHNPSERYLTCHEFILGKSGGDLQQSIV